MPWADQFNSKNCLAFEDRPSVGLDSQPAALGRTHLAGFVGPRDTFKQAMAQASYTSALTTHDMQPVYMSSAAYLKLAQDTFVGEKALVEKRGLLQSSVFALHRNPSDF